MMNAKETKEKFIKEAYACEESIKFIIEMEIKVLENLKNNNIDFKVGENIFNIIENSKEEIRKIMHEKITVVKSMKEIPLEASIELINIDGLPSITFFQRR